MRPHLVVVLAGALAMTGLSAAGSEIGACEVDRMRASAQAYMPAMIEGAVDPTVWEDVPLAPNVRRVEHPPGTYNGTPARGGPVTGKTADQIRAVSVSLPTLRVTTKAREWDRADRQWFDAERCEMVAFWLIDLGMRNPSGSPNNFGTVHVAERFRFRPADHHITQIDAYFSQDLVPNASSCWPAVGDEGRAGPCTTTTPAERRHCAPSSDERMRDAVRGYHDALRSHDPSALSLADDVRRTEFPPPAGRGPVTASTADEVRTSLATEPRFTSITGVRDERWFVDRHNCTVIVFYLVDATAPTTSEPVQPGLPFTVHVAERYHVSRGELVEIEQIAYPHQHSTPEGSCWTAFDNDSVSPMSERDVNDYQFMGVPCPAGY